MTDAVQRTSSKEPAEAADWSRIWTHTLTSLIIARLRLWTVFIDYKTTRTSGKLLKASWRE